MTKDTGAKLKDRNDRVRILSVLNGTQEEVTFSRFRALMPQRPTNELKATLSKMARIGELFQSTRPLKGAGTPVEIYSLNPILIESNEQLSRRIELQILKILKIGGMEISEMSKMITEVSQSRINKLVCGMCDTGVLDRREVGVKANGERCYMYYLPAVT